MGRRVARLLGLRWLRCRGLDFILSELRKLLKNFKQGVIFLKECRVTVIGCNRRRKQEATAVAQGRHDCGLAQDVSCGGAEKWMSLDIVF